MSELTEALAGLEQRLKAAIPTVEQVAEAAAQKLLPTIDAAVKGAVADAGPLGSVAGIVVDPLIDDFDAYVEGLLTGTVPATTAPPVTVATLTQKVAALAVATGVTSSHAYSSALATVATLPAPQPANPAPVPVGKSVPEYA
jgi:hypothetical protein